MWKTPRKILEKHCKKRKIVKKCPKEDNRFLEAGGGCDIIHVQDSRKRFCGKSEIVEIQHGFGEGAKSEKSASLK